jgi:hypothetical protein
VFGALCVVAHLIAAVEMLTIQTLIHIPVVFHHLKLKVALNTNTIKMYFII